MLSDSLVHLLCVPFALLAPQVSLAAAARRGAGDRTLAGLRVYAVGMCLSLLASAVYNTVGCGLHWYTAWLRRIDHAAIYIHIAGSCACRGASAGQLSPKHRSGPLSTSSGKSRRLTPFPFAPPDTPLLLHVDPGVVSSFLSNETVLALIWGVAVGGALLKLLLARRFETAGLLLYVALAGAVVFFTHAVTDGFPGGVALLWEFVRSGACYLFGLVFYLGDDIPHSNALWHACILVGCATHWRIVHAIVGRGWDSFPLPPMPPTLVAGT